MINNEYIEILGTKISTLSMNQTIQEITLWCHSNEKHYICTADAYMLYLASNDKNVQNIINNASLVTPDSSGTILASKICKTPIKEKVSGCVLAENLCKLSGDNDLRIFFLGAKPGIPELAAKKMKSKYKNIKVAGVHHGYFDANENQSIIKMINDSKANVLLVAFGIPKQEQWIAENLPNLNINVAIGVGGTFDVMSETVSRAPEIYQKLNLEWLFRYFQNPKKSYKLGVLPKFFIKVLKYKNKNGK